MDLAINQLTQEILISDSFKVWVFEKAIQDMVVFYYEEHAVYAYVYELAYGFPLQAFPWQPSKLGMFSVRVGLPSASEALSTRYISPGTDFSQ